MREYIILDRDGTIIVEKKYLHDPTEVQFEYKALEALELLQRDYQLIIVTNQSGIGRKYFSREQYYEVESYIDNQFRVYGLTQIPARFCPHVLEDDCDCRKPNIGLVRDLFEQNKVKYVVGDKESDLLFGQKVNAQSVLVLTGYGRKTLSSGIDQNMFQIYENLYEFAMNLEHTK
jgi:D-glycero-D-manno-heptose 1,7-bisphosphate phosphatase